MIHDLKILPEHFWPVVSSQKKAEVRLNDRNFQEGDYLRLMEWSASKGYTGRNVVRLITHIADLSSWREGYVLLSMRELG